MQYKIKVVDSNPSEYLCEDQEDLLDAAIKKGLKIPYACKGGGCGMCKIKVLSGQYERGKSSQAVLPDLEREKNYSLSCKTYPNSDMEILIHISQ